VTSPKPTGEVDIDEKFETVKASVADLRDKIIRSDVFKQHKELHGTIQWGFADIMKLLGDLEGEVNKVRKA